MKHIMIGMISIFLFITACDTLSIWQSDMPDNALEEQIEDIIEDITGKDIDLTPLSGDEQYNKEK